MTALADDEIDEFNLPVAGLAVVVVPAAMAGVAAAIGPRRAARLNVLGAIASD